MLATPNAVHPQTLLRLPTVLALRGRAKSGHYVDIQAGLFPPPVRCGERSAAWPAGEVLAINAARIAGKSDAEIRALVGRLVAERKKAAVSLSVQAGD
jgi:prophage regulatory protein